MCRWLALSLLCGCLIWAGCLPKSEAVGSNHEVVVVVSPELWIQVEDVVESIFGKIMYTPQEEKIFTLRVVEPEDFDFYRKFRNVMVLGPLNEETGGGELVTSLISVEAKAQVLAGEAYMFLKEDIWSRGQTIMIVAGPDEDGLRSLLLDHGDEIFAVQESALNKKVEVWLYEKGDQKKLSRKLSRSYGWTLRVPEEYSLDQELSAERFLFFRRTVPERWLFVYWEDAVGPEALTEQWCRETRSRIGSTFYRGDEIVEEMIRTEWETFGEWEALSMKGLWQNSTPEAGYAAGGPFRNYSFYDEKTRRLYMIDIAVFAPGVGKESYLRQLDIIARTFRI